MRPYVNEIWRIIPAFSAENFRPAAGAQTAHCIGGEDAIYFFQMGKGGSRMELKKIWMSPDTGRGSRFARRTVDGVLGIALLMLLLIGGGVWLSFRFGLPRELFAAGLCFGVTALAAALAVLLGRRSMQDATVFFLTADDRLYALDARGAVRFGRGAVGFAAGAAEVQELLRGISDGRSLPSSADELLKVERLRENRSHYVIKCRVRRRGGRVFTRAYFLVKGYEDEDELLRQLELRRRWDAELEFAESRTPLRLLICVLVFAGFAALCVFSHPAVARLPEGIYFPCLAAAFAALFGAVYFGILLRRGE